MAQSSPKEPAGRVGPASATVNPAKAPSFEQNLERLDAIVHELDDAELPLEKALELYEEGMKVSAVCEQQLEAAEGRVEVLRKRAGKTVAEPFQEEESKGP